MSSRERAALSLQNVRQFFFRTRYNYSKTFGGDAGEFVLRDLSRYVHLNKPINNGDEQQVRFLLGQQSVVYRIIGQLNMTDEQIFNLTKEPEER